MRKDQKHFSYVILEFLPLYYTLNKNAFFSDYLIRIKTNYESSSVYM